VVVDHRCRGDGGSSTSWSICFLSRSVVDHRCSLSVVDRRCRGGRWSSMVSSWWSLVSSSSIQREVSFLLSLSLSLDLSRSLSSISLLSGSLSALSLSLSISLCCGSLYLSLLSLSRSLTERAEKARERKRDQSL